MNHVDSCVLKTLQDAISPFGGSQILSPGLKQARSLPEFGATPRN